MRTSATTRQLLASDHIEVLADLRSQLPAAERVCSEDLDEGLFTFLRGGGRFDLPAGYVSIELAAEGGLLAVANHNVFVGTGQVLVRDGQLRGIWGPRCEVKTMVRVSSCHA